MHARSSLQIRFQAIGALLLALGLVLAVAGCGSNGGGSSDVSPSKVVVVSDVHFNPFYDPAIFDDLVTSDASEWQGIFEGSAIQSPPTWGEEANYPLLASTLESASRKQDTIALVVFPGDILAHRFDTQFYELYGQTDETALRQFILKTVTFFASQVRQAFGDAPVVFTLGNNDAYAGDYALVPGGQFLQDTAELFYATFLLAGADSAAYFDTYPKGGYYTARPAGSKAFFVCLNSVLFSTHRDPPVVLSEDPGWIMLDWLETTLEKARDNSDKVWLLTHIPPGADIFSTAHNKMDADGHIDEWVPMWQQLYLDRFLTITADYADVIDFSFGGHTHMDEFRLYVDKNGQATEPMVVSASISPIFGNSPAYKVFTLDTETWDMQNYESSSYDLMAEAGYALYYDFQEDYGYGVPLEQALIDLFPALGTEEERANAYRTYYYSGNNLINPINDENWPIYRCGVGRMVEADYVECVNASN